MSTLKVATQGRAGKGGRPRGDSLGEVLQVVADCPDVARSFLAFALAA